MCVARSICTTSSVSWWPRGEPHGPWHNGTIDDALMVFITEFTMVTARIHTGRVETSTDQGHAERVVKHNTILRFFHAPCMPENHDFQIWPDQVAMALASIARYGRSGH